MGPEEQTPRPEEQTPVSTHEQDWQGHDGIMVEISWTERWLLPVLAVGVVLDLIISVFLGVLQFEQHTTTQQVNHAVATALRSQETQYDSCLVTNDTRSSNLTLWVENHHLWAGVILSFFKTPPGAPPAEVAATNQFKGAIQAEVDSQLALAQRINQPRDCSTLKVSSGTNSTSGLIALDEASATNGVPPPRWSAALVAALAVLGFNTLMFSWIARRLFKTPAPTTTTPPQVGG